MPALKEHPTELKRDPAIELARLIGCLIVIGCHTYLPLKVNDRFEPGRLFFGMLFADGVAVFWLIGGAFLLNYTDYKKLLAGRIKKVLLPMCAVGLLYFLYASYKEGNRTVHDLIFNYEAGYKNVIDNLLKWKNGITGYDHSWYIYVYMLLIVALPVLKYTVKFVDRSRQRKILLVGGIILILAVNDLSRNRLVGFSLYRLRGLAGACLITLIGYYLYQAREFFKKRLFLIIAPAVFIVTNILREVVQLHREAAGYVDDKSIMYWYTLFGLIAASCILIFCMALIRDKKATACNRTICYLASYTFPIYLIHLLIRYVFDSVGLTKNLQHSVLTWNSGAAGEAVYLTIIISLLFWCSFFVVFIFRKIDKIRRL